MTQNKKESVIRVWDIWTRTFHWCFASAVIFLLISGETGWLFFDWHRSIGEFVLLLVVFRLLWGFFGSSNSRLLPLVSNPRLAFSHIVELIRGNALQVRGHNAAGGWAVLAMLLLVSFQAASGLFIADEDELIEGKFYGLIDYELSEKLLHLHHLNARFLIIFTCLHVFMILFYLLRARQNLIKPMITGQMLWKQSNTPPTIRWTPVWIGMLLFLSCLAALGWGLDWFPFL